MNAQCRFCHGRGLIVKPGEDVAVPCVCTRQQRLDNLLRRAGLPPRLQDCSFASFDLRFYSRHLPGDGKSLSYYDMARLALQAAMRFVEDFTACPQGDGLLFTGPVGSGKTFLSCCIANELLSRGCAVQFVVVPDMLDMLRASYRGEQDLTESDLMEPAREVPLLILDDLGAHSYTEWARQKLYSLLNYRLNYRLPVIITTNIGLGDLETFLGERTTSRICQMCRPYRLQVDTDIRIALRRGTV
ncbi:ATP-binding protein [Desulfurispora thermophila]|uniref:ATP-binding protein n=1 Tax=Desulfurispora thermophila TaxID=265470 RepID=UPI00035E97C5|nr:ATP-binding protein [Desulfurispora thermophila]